MEEEDGRYSCSCSYSCYDLTCWYGYGVFDVIVPPRKHKKVDEEKGADGRMDDCCLNNVGMDFTFRLSRDTRMEHGFSV